jgi:hypothetical protein
MIFRAIMRGFSQRSKAAPLQALGEVERNLSSVICHLS